MFLRCGPCSGDMPLLLFPLLYSFTFLSSSETLRLFTLCCSHSAYLLFHISTFALLSCTWLMTVWYLSRVPSVPWYALLCHCCRLVSLFSSSSSFFFSTPGSHPTLTYVSASDVLIYNRTMLITMLNSSPTLLVTPPHHTHDPSIWTPPSFVPICVFLHPTLCPPPHGRTSWDRSTVHWERLWAHLPVGWRNLWGECSFYCVFSISMWQG